MFSSKAFLSLPLLLLLTFNMVTIPQPASAGSFDFKDNQLRIDGVAQPQLWGAEIQYFRLRGGQGRNIPRAKVLEIWNKALDRAVEAKMNAIEFYIPWDFHEYADGKFDFDGTADEDGDGLPDYPSRDVHTWFKLVEGHGIKIIHARPGPFINAEWGFLGFGAIPLWFHEKFPESHCVNPRGQKTSLYSYSDTNFRKYSKRWLEKVYNEVLKPYIGPGRPVTFLQIDNETNLMWQSIYNHDYSPRSVGLYQNYLKDVYGGSLQKVNSTHNRTWQDWKEIKPPEVFGANIDEDQDWYRYQDENMRQYLRWIRQVWEGMGVKEPTVLFTLAESYNALSQGILPNYKIRNEPNSTGLMTVNLYPKTYETADRTLMNLPFKTDHDVKAADIANDTYLGSKQEWVMGPEIQAGWWRGVHVSQESRRQTYLSTLGHGMKAIFLYYFNEGENWQSTWAKEQIQPLYDKLKEDPRFKTIAHDQLPDDFWRELDATVADTLFVSWSSRYILSSGGTHPQTLYFDAPLGPDAEPRAPYAAVKEFGEKVMEPYGAFLATATEVTDNVCILRDDAQHAPSKVSGVNSLIMNSDWAGGLLALLFHSGINPKIVHWDLGGANALKECKLVVYQDNGFASADLAQALEPVLARGGAVLSFLDTGLFDLLKGKGAGTNPQLHLAATGDSCVRLPPLPMEVDGAKCAVLGGAAYYARVPIYDVFNTDFYSRVHDVPARRDWMQMILGEVGIEGQFRIKGGSDRVVTYARQGPDGDHFWITAKSGRLDPYSGAIQYTRAKLDKDYLVKDVFSGATVRMTGAQFKADGFSLSLGASGSTAFYVEAVPTAAEL